MFGAQVHCLIIIFTNNTIERDCLGNRLTCFILSNKIPKFRWMMGTKSFFGRADKFFVTFFTKVFIFSLKKTEILIIIWLVSALKDCVGFSFFKY